MTFIKRRGEVQKFWMIGFISFSRKRENFFDHLGCAHFQKAKLLSFDRKFFLLFFFWFLMFCCVLETYFVLNL